MFGSIFASFNTFPSIGESPFGELTFTHLQIPFEKLDMASLERTSIDIRTDYDFVLPLDNGERIVTFKRYLDWHEIDKCFTQMSCSDRHGHLISTVNIYHHVYKGMVTPCGPSTFVVCHHSYSYKLSVYDSGLQCVRGSDCKNFSHLCCNSKFVFGLLDTRSERSETDSNDDDDEHEEGEKHSQERIQVCHLDTLKEAAFGLRVPEEYTMERIMADEQHVVAMGRVGSESFWQTSTTPRRWFMSIFELSGKESWAGKTKSRRLFLAERHIELTIQSQLPPEMSLLNGWLILPLVNRLVWFDKK